MQLRQCSQSSAVSPGSAVSPITPSPHFATDRHAHHTCLAACNAGDLEWRAAREAFCSAGTFDSPPHTPLTSLSPVVSPLQRRGSGRRRGHDLASPTQQSRLSLRSSASFTRPQLSSPPAAHPQANVSPREPLGSPHSALADSNVLANHAVTAHQPVEDDDEGWEDSLTSLSTLLQLPNSLLQDHELWCRRAQAWRAACSDAGSASTP